MSDIKYSIHFDENGEVVAVTGPPEDLSALTQADPHDGSPICVDEGVQITAPNPVPTILTKDGIHGNCRCCIYVPGYGVICWNC